LVNKYFREIQRRINNFYAINTYTAVYYKLLSDHILIANLTWCWTGGKTACAYILKAQPRSSRSIAPDPSGTFPKLSTVAPFNCIIESQINLWSIT